MTSKDSNIKISPLAFSGDNSFPATHRSHADETGHIAIRILGIKKFEDADPSKTSLSKEFADKASHLGIEIDTVHVELSRYGIKVMWDTAVPVESIASPDEVGFDAYAEFARHKFTNDLRALPPGSFLSLAGAQDGIRAPMPQGKKLKEIKAAVIPAGGKHFKEVCQISGPPIVGIAAALEAIRLYKSLATDATIKILKEAQGTIAKRFKELKLMLDDLPDDHEDRRPIMRSLVRFHEESTALIATIEDAKKGLLVNILVKPIDYGSVKGGLLSTDFPEGDFDGSTTKTTVANKGDKGRKDRTKLDNVTDILQRGLYKAVIILVTDEISIARQKAWLNGGKAYHARKLNTPPIDDKKTKTKEEAQSALLVSMDSKTANDEISKNAVKAKMHELAVLKRTEKGDYFGKLVQIGGTVMEYIFQVSDDEELPDVPSVRAFFDSDAYKKYGTYRIAYFDVLPHVDAAGILSTAMMFHVPMEEGGYVNFPQVAEHIRLVLELYPACPSDIADSIENLASIISELDHSEQPAIYSLDPPDTILELCNRLKTITAKKESKVLNAYDAIKLAAGVSATQGRSWDPRGDTSTTSLLSEKEVQGIQERIKAAGTAAPEAAKGRADSDDDFSDAKTSLDDSPGVAGPDDSETAAKPAAVPPREPDNDARTHPEPAKRVRGGTKKAPEEEPLRDDPACSHTGTPSLPHTPSGKPSSPLDTPVDDGVIDGLSNSQMPISPDQHADSEPNYEPAKSLATIFGTPTASDTMDSSPQKSPGASGKKQMRVHDQAEAAAAELAGYEPVFAPTPPGAQQSSPSLEGDQFATPDQSPSEIGEK